MNIKGEIYPENKAGDFPSGVPDSQEQLEPQPKRKKQSK